MSSFIDSKKAKLASKKEKVFAPGHYGAFSGLFGSVEAQRAQLFLAIKEERYWMVITGAKEFKEPMTAIRSESPVVFESINAFKYALKIYGPEGIKEHLTEVPTLIKYKNAPQRELSGFFYHANFNGPSCQYTLEFEVLADGEEGSSRIIRVSQLKTHESISYAKKISSVDDKCRLLKTPPFLKQLLLYGQHIEKLFKIELTAYAASKRTKPKPVKSKLPEIISFYHAGVRYDLASSEIMSVGSKIS